MHAREPFGEEGGGDSTGGEAFAGEGFVGEGDAVQTGFKGNGVDMSKNDAEYLFPHSKYTAMFLKMQVFRRFFCYLSS